MSKLLAIVLTTVLLAFTIAACCDVGGHSADRRGPSESTMPHNPPIFPPGPIPDHHVITPCELEKLDTFQSEALDGEDGGTYAPLSPIAIGGAGLQLQGSGNNCTGLVSTGRDSKGLILPPSIVPIFETPRTRRVVVPLLAVTDISREALGTYEYVSDPYGIKSLRTSQGSWAFRIPSHRLHHGATLLSARLCWRPGAPPTSIATLGDADEMPWFRFIRLKKAGAEAADYSPNIIETWKVPSRANSTAYALGAIVHSTGGGDWEGSNGYTYRCVVAGTSAGAQPTPSTTIGADWSDGTVTWRVEPGYTDAFGQFRFPPIPAGADPFVLYNGGLPQAIEHPVNLNTVVDTENYTYAVEIIDPGKYRNVYHSVVIEMGNITSLREP